MLPRCRASILFTQELDGAKDGSRCLRRAIDDDTPRRCLLIISLDFLFSAARLFDAFAFAAAAERLNGNGNTHSTAALMSIFFAAAFSPASAPPRCRHYATPPLPFRHDATLRHYFFFFRLIRHVSAMPPPSIDYLFRLLIFIDYHHHSDYSSFSLPSTPPSLRTLQDNA